MSAEWDAVGVTNRLILGILAGEERKPLLDAFRAHVRAEVLNELAADALEHDGHITAQELRRMASPAPAAPRCDVTFVGGGQCSKAAGHRTPQNQDPHTPASVESAGDETGEAVEYGVRNPSGRVGDVTLDRALAEAEFQWNRKHQPDAVLVQRSVRYGAWVEVAS